VDIEHYEAIIEYVPSIIGHDKATAPYRDPVILGGSLGAHKIDHEGSDYMRIMEWIKLALMTQRYPEGTSVQWPKT